MKIFTETAIASIKANEEAELRVISFALGLLSSRVHLGTDFVDYGAWGIGFKCHQYITTCNLRNENTFYTSAQYLEAAASAMKDYIAKREEYADLTACIFSEDGDVVDVLSWAEKCKVDSVIRELLEVIVGDPCEDTNDEIFIRDGVSGVRYEMLIADFSLKAMACVLVSVWQGLGEK